MHRLGIAVGRSFPINKSVLRQLRFAKNLTNPAYGLVFGAENRAIFFSENPGAEFLAEFQFLPAPDSFFDSFDEHLSADSD